MRAQHPCLRTLTANTPQNLEGIDLLPARAALVYLQLLAFGRSSKSQRDIPGRFINTFKSTTAHMGLIWKSLQVKFVDKQAYECVVFSVAKNVLLASYRSYMTPYDT